MTRTARPIAASALLAALLTACGGGGDDPIAPTPLPTPTASIALGAATATVQAGSTTTVAVTLTRGGGFAGDVALTVAGAPTGVSVAGQSIAAGATTATLSIVSTSAARPDTATLTVSGAGTGVVIAPQTVKLTVTAASGAITQTGNEITNDDGGFAAAVALSADGSRVVVGARSSANGTTRVYQRVGAGWTQLGGDIIGEASGDRAGVGVDINAAGTRIAIGAYENSNAVSRSGHVRVYDLVGTNWTQVGADIDGATTRGGFGWRVALSGSGNRLIVGSPSQNTVAGAARVFDLVGGTWTQVGATLTGTNKFGDDVDVSSDGSTIAVSAPFNPTGSVSPSVYAYRLVGGAWTPAGNVLTGLQTRDSFGDGISLSANGSRIAISASAHQRNLSVPAGLPAGIVRVFDLVGSTWTQIGNSVLGSDEATRNNDKLGQTLSLSDDGTRFAATISGANEAVVYTIANGTWTLTGGTIVGPTTGFGNSEGLALSPDGKTVAVGSAASSPPGRVRVYGIAP